MGTLSTWTDRAAGTLSPTRRQRTGSAGTSPLYLLLGGRICARSRMWLQSFALHRTFAHVYSISPARHDRTVSFTSRLRTRLSPPLQNPCLSPLALTLRPSYWATSHCAATDSAIPLHYVEGIQSGTIQAHARRIQHPVLNL